MSEARAREEQERRGVGLAAPNKETSGATELEEEASV